MCMLYLYIFDYDYFMNIEIVAICPVSNVFSKLYLENVYLCNNCIAFIEFAIGGDPMVNLFYI